MLELLLFKISTSFMSLNLESWLLEIQLNMGSVWLKSNTDFFFPQGKQLYPDSCSKYTNIQQEKKKWYRKYARKKTVWSQTTEG